MKLEDFRGISCLCIQLQFQTIASFFNFLSSFQSTSCSEATVPKPCLGHPQTLKSPKRASPTLEHGPLKHYQLQHPLAVFRHRHSPNHPDEIRAYQGFLHSVMDLMSTLSPVA